MLKRTSPILFILLFLGFGLSCYSQTQFSPVITKMEKSLFGLDYSAQSDEDRVKRIEEVVYGAPSSNPLAQRIDKLSKDLAADQMGQEIKPRNDTFAEDSDAIKDIPKADGSVNYPIINALEKKVFSKEYKTMEVNKRLASLELQVFRQTYNDDLNTRVDRLKQAVLPESIASADSSDFSEYKQTLFPEESGYAADIPLDVPMTTQGPPSKAGQKAQGDDPEIAVPLASLEKCILKKSFPNDSIPNRLTRLELMIFNATFTDEDEQTRFDRIASAYQAKKSSQKYDNNKFAQHVATAMEFGAFLLCILAAIL